MIRYFTISIFIFFSLELIGQSKRNLKLFKDANYNYDIGEFNLSVEGYNKILKSDPENCDVLFKLGLAHKKLKEFNEFKNTFVKYSNLSCSNYSDQVHFDLSNYFLGVGLISKSAFHLNQIKIKEAFDLYSELVDRINFIKNFDQNISINHLDIDSIDNFPLQYSPSYNPSDENIFFTARSGYGMFDDENIYTLNIRENGFIGNISIFKFLNTENNEGSVTFSDDGKLLIFTSCKMNFKKNSCDLFISYHSGSGWGVPVRLNERINSDYWDSQPHLHGDSLLLFVSNRPGGKGGRDIWYSRLGLDGNWSDANNYSDINSKFDDISPYVYNGIIYFTSNRIESFGGLDVFYLKGGVKEKSRVLNIGNYVNNSNDQSSFLINDQFMLVTEETKYTREVKSKIILSEVKSNDIYGTEPIRLFIKDENSKIPIKSNTIIKGSDNLNEYYNLLGGSILLDKEDIILGDVVIYADNYFPKKINIEMADTLEIFLTKINDNYTLEDIVFEYDSYELSELAKSNLNYFIEWLKLHVGVNLKIEGHTDSVGSDKYNAELSKRRAEEVLSFLVSKGIDKNKIRAVGLGDKYPIRKGYDGPRNRRIQVSIF